MKILPVRDEDVDVVVGLFRNYGFALQERDWYDWKYSATPYPIKAASYKIIENDKIVGAVALLPRIFHYEGRRVWGIQAVDGLMGKEIRGRGLFNEVMAFLRDHLPEGIEDGFFYLSFPSLPESVKAHRNAGWHCIGDSELHSFFFNMNILHKMKRLSWLAPILTPIVRLRNAWYLSKAPGTVRIEAIERFQEDMNIYFDGARIAGDRSADFMNWRTVDNPKDTIRSYWIVEADDKVGYVVCKVHGRNMEIMDMKFRHDDPKYLISFLRYLQQKGMADSLDYRIFDNHPYRRLLGPCGLFRRSGQGAMFVHDLEKAGFPEGGECWEINYLDSDW